MKIAFLTSCLEPGRDGVGDYTRRLAEECDRQGHQVCLIALNDPYVGKTVCTHGMLRLPIGGDAIPGVQGHGDTWGRTSGTMSPPSIEIAHDFIREFSPDFVSLQFVCYGFHPKGIDFRLAGRLRQIVGDVPVQLMFHELWIGAERHARWKHRFMGMLQRAALLPILRQLNVRVVHTSNPAYLALLQARGIPATCLPLFGNIPELQQEPKARTASDGWRFGLYGTLHPVWPPELLFAQLGRLGKKIVISHMGRMGAGEALWEKMRRDYAGVFEFERLGEQTPEQIADFFSTLDFGLAATPWEIIGKSGSVAAMLEHGLPVIVNRDEVHYRGWRQEGYSPLLIKMGNDLPVRLAAARRGPVRLILPDVARQFLQALA